MTPKEKAIIILKKQLHNVSGVPENLILMFHKSDSHVETARQCALICVDVILENMEGLHKPEYTTFILDGQKMDGYELSDYWIEVSNEIKKL